ncbi:response regulator [Shewanella sp. 10N.286.48.A6]|uniref:response regulator n=1 Tax=Shewanella sp. 10N.286.48.A6 TaxID=1880833 RepID=UPI000C818E18|nr:response regulator [Shewanella sp. 10N.286.48.A6]PMI02161.1 histidine kinase [Shewanella sp. 10N.286.48.A6]
MEKRTVVVIDDDPVCTGLLLAILGDEYRVMTANSGDAAIEMFASIRPNLIFVDITMPNINGYQVIKFIKDQPETANIPIVVVSSLVEASDQELALKIGADDYLTKPIMPNDVQKTIDRFLS